MIPGTGNRVVERRPPGGRRELHRAPRSASRAGVNYTLTTNDFTASGGDGYPNNRSRMTTQDILDQDLADYLAAVPGGVISPAIQHRIHCTDPNPGSGVALPGRLALDELELRGPAASRGGPPAPSSARRRAARAPTTAATISHVLVPPVARRPAAGA